MTPLLAVSASSSRSLAVAIAGSTTRRRFRRAPARAGCLHLPDGNVRSNAQVATANPTKNRPRGGASMRPRRWPRRSGRRHLQRSEDQRRRVHREAIRRPPSPWRLPRLRGLPRGCGRGKGSARGCRRQHKGQEAHRSGEHRCRARCRRRAFRRSCGHPRKRLRRMHPSTTRGTAAAYNLIKRPGVEKMAEDTGREGRRDLRDTLKRWRDEMELAVTKEAERGG